MFTINIPVERYNYIYNGINVMYIRTGWWLKNPLKNMSSSVGMMTFPTEWNNNPKVPNHQPGN
jgi:hypothetical protein